MPANAAFGLALDKLDVVVVEESRTLQALTCSMLSSYRVKRIRPFGGAEAALQSMLNDPPHLIIADWQMKPVSGYQLLRMLHEPDMMPLCLVPFIMTSTFATQRLVELSSQTGAHAFLVKPLSPMILRNAINRILADSREMKLTAERYVVEGAAQQLAEVQAAAAVEENRRRTEPAEPAQPTPQVRPARRGYGAVMAERS